MFSDEEARKEALPCIIVKKAGRESKQPIYEATVQGVDAWGKDHRCVVRWIPLTVEAGPALDNVGCQFLVWPEDYPPIYAKRGQFGDVCFVRCPVEVTDDTQFVYTPIRKDSEDELDEGCYYIVNET